MLCALTDFPYYPSEDEVPLCEIEGKLHFALQDAANLHVFTSSVSSHPFVLITNTCLHPIVAKTLSNKVFLPVTDRLSHRLQNAWYEGGLVQVLEILANPEEHSFMAGCFLAKNLLLALNTLNKFKTSFLNRREKKIVDTVRTYGPIVCISWHPHCSKLAVVSSDDCVNIFSIHCTLNPVLKAKTQRQITSIAWRPLSGCEIAVACYEGVYVWTVDPNSVISRPSISSATLLQTPGHRAISSVAWSPQGDILASASMEDKTMYIWDVEMKTNIPLRRVGGSGIQLLSWSPHGSKLVATTTSTVFRVWKSDDVWESENWKSVGGSVRALVWSPGTSSVLLFASHGQPYLYAMPTGSKSNFFTSRTNDSRTAAHIVADFTKISLNSGDWVGGEVLDMAWDRRGKHLAVLFEECPILAIYLTNVTPLFHVIPGFFIRGTCSAIPTAICFQNDFEEGANLTIAWDNGRLQYFPILFNEEPLPNLNITTASLHDKSARYFSFTSP